MTISTTALTKSYSGNGVTTAFSFPYRFLANADLVVTLIAADGTETLQVLTTDYTIVGAGDDAGGTVTMITAPASGETLFIRRDVELTQEVDYITGESFPAETHERALDRLTMITQQLTEATERSIRLSETDFSGANTVLPTPVAGQYLKINATSDGIEYDAGTNANQAAAVETQTLASGQTSVVFTSYVSPAAFYLSGPDVDSGRLTLGDDYTVNAATKTVTLTQSYPAGTKLVMVYVDGSADLYSVSSGEVSYAPSGTGAVTTTVESKLRETVSVKDFGAVGDGVTDDTAAIQAAYNYIQSLGGGTVVWPKATYYVAGTILFGSHARTEGNNSTINIDSNILFQTAYQYPLISTDGLPESSSVYHRHSSFHDLQVQANTSLNGTAFSLNWFTSNCHLHNITFFDVAQAIKGTNCFFSSYEELYYFGAADYVTGTANTTASSNVIVVTNAIAATLSVGMEFVSHFTPLGTTIDIVGGADSAGSGIAFIWLSNNATLTGTAGAINTGFAASQSPVGLYEFSGAGSDMTFTKCSASGQFIGFDLGSVNSSTFISCDSEGSVTAFKVHTGSANNSWLSTHTEGIYGWCWDFSGNTGTGNSLIHGYNPFNIAGIITAGTTGALSGSIILPETAVGFTPYGWDSAGQPWVDLSSSNCSVNVVNGGSGVLLGTANTNKSISNHTTQVVGQLQFAPGNGATVTQITSRATSVTINAFMGNIITDTTSLAAGASATFSVFNNKVSADDVILLSIAGGTVSDSIVSLSQVAGGSFNIKLFNLHPSVAETGAIQINFMVIKAHSS